MLLLLLLVVIVIVVSCWFVVVVSYQKLEKKTNNNCMKRKKKILHPCLEVLPGCHSHPSRGGISRDDILGFRTLKPERRISSSPKKESGTTMWFGVWFPHHLSPVKKGIRLQHSHVKLFIFFFIIINYLSQNSPCIDSPVFGFSREKSKKCFHQHLSRTANRRYF